MSDCIKLDHIEENLAFLLKMYDMIRFVDPINKTVVDSWGNLNDIRNAICYDYWGNGKICDNCISIRAYSTNKTFFKLDVSADGVMMVTAIPIENEGIPMVVELFKNATETMLISFGAYADGCLIHKMVKRINDLVIKDELTGVYNRRYANERLPSDIAQSVLKELPLSLIFLDLDELKEVNNAYGHVYGDRTLTAVTQALSQCIHTGTDWIARYGGDEFLICLHNTTDEGAYQIAKRIRQAISRLIISFQGIEIHPTVSLGIHTMFGSPLTAEECIAFADRKLYEEKKRRKR